MITRIFRTSLLALPLLFALIVPPAIHAITPPDSAISWRMQSDDFADRGFSTGFELFYAGPEWFLNALSNPRSRNPFVKSFVFDNTGDRLGAENGYVGTLRDVFDVSHFTFSGVSSSKTSGSTFQPVPRVIGGDSGGGGIPTAPNAILATGSWNVDASGDWSNSANWLGGTIADGAGSTGNFTFLITATRTITIDGASRTLGIINIGGPDNYIIAASGGGTLTFDNSGSNAQINQTSTSGENTISAPILLNSPLDITNASPNNLTLSGEIWASTAGTKTITTSTGTVTISGAIGNGSGTVAVVQNGAGTLTLTGTNTYTGLTTVANDGRLFINGNSSAATGAINVNSGGTTLGGSGITGGDVTVASGSNLSPGPTGVGSVADLGTGALTLQSGSFFNVDLNSTTVYDQVLVTGTVSVSGSNLVVSSTFTPALGNIFFIVVNDDGPIPDPVSGLFGTVSPGWVVSYTADFDSGQLLGGNDIALVAVPEPSTWIGAALALAAIGFTQRRRFSRVIRKPA